MSFSNKIKNSFNDYYNLKRLYYTTLYKNTKNADSDNVFFGDLKLFDKIEKWYDKCLMQEELENPPQAIKNMIITLCNCFGQKFIQRWLDTYLYSNDKSLTCLDELDNEKECIKISGTQNSH